MEKDFLQSLDYVGLTARIKRLSDGLVHDGKRIYEHSELEIEPNWHIILLLLKDRKELTVTEIARSLSFSHPAIIKITKRMKEKGYLTTKADDSDNRKTLILLSKKSLKLFPSFEKKWGAIGSVLQDVMDKEFIRKLGEIENRLRHKSVSDRVLEAAARPIVAMVDFEEKHAKDFYDLNVEWLETYFYVEEYDEEVLSKPQEYILDEGGLIQFAIVDSKVVGTYALIDRGKEGYELSKMAVTPDYRGRKIGLALMHAAIRKAKEIGTKRLYLESNTKLTPAINLYRKLGFKEVPAFDGSPYKRSNIVMELKL